MSAQPWRARLDRGLQQTVEQIVERYAPEKTLLFGSMSRGDIHEYSDLDLLIHSIPTRYPDALPDCSPHDAFGSEDADDAIIRAERILQSVTNAI